MGLSRLLNIDAVFEKVSSYLEARLELFKIEAKEEVSLILGKFVIYLLIFGCALFFMFLLSIALALKVGLILQNYPLGFVIISGFYLILCIFLFIIRDKLKLDKLFFDLLNPEKDKKEDV